MKTLVLALLVVLGLGVVVGQASSQNVVRFSTHVGFQGVAVVGEGRAQVRVAEHGYTMLFYLEGLERNLTLHIFVEAVDVVLNWADGEGNLRGIENCVLEVWPVLMDKLLSHVQIKSCTGLSKVELYLAATPKPVLQLVWSRTKPIEPLPFPLPCPRLPSRLNPICPTGTANSAAVLS